MAETKTLTWQHTGGDAATAESISIGAGTDITFSLSPAATTTGSQRSLVGRSLQIFFADTQDSAAAVNLYGSDVTIVDSTLGMATVAMAATKTLTLPGGSYKGEVRDAASGGNTVLRRVVLKIVANPLAIGVTAAEVPATFSWARLYGTPTSIGGYGILDGATTSNPLSQFAPGGAIDTSVKDRGGQVYNVESTAFAGGATGGANDSAPIQAAILAAYTAGGGIVQLVRPVYRGNVTLYPKVILQGCGSAATMLKSVAGSNLDVVKGLNFDTLTGKAYASGDTQRGAYQAQIRALTIDGDKATQTTGNGIRLWGRSLQFHDVIIQNCKQYGIWTEFTTHDAGAVNDMIEGLFDGVKINGCDVGGWEFRGPHDSVILNFNPVSNGGWGFRSESSAGSFVGGVKGSFWNGWLNTTGCFSFGDVCEIDNIDATGASGIQINIEPDVGSCTIKGLVAGATGIIIRGTNHNIDLIATNCTTAVQLGDDLAAGYGGIQLNIVGTGNTTGVVFKAGATGSVGVHGVIGCTTLYTGTPGSSSDAISLRQTGGSNTVLHKVPGQSITSGYTGYSPQWPQSNGVILCSDGGINATLGTLTTIGIVACVGLTNTAGLSSIKTASNTNTAFNLATFRANSSGTVAAGFGQEHSFDLMDTGGSNVVAAKVTVDWNVATHSATRGEWVLSVGGPSGLQEIMRGRAGGAAGNLGFLGASPVGVQSSPDAGTALVNLGVASGTPTFGYANLTGSTAPLASGFIFTFNAGDFIIQHMGLGTLNLSGTVTMGTPPTPFASFHLYRAGTATTFQGIVENNGAGDASLAFLCTGAYECVYGIDYSDSGTFKICNGAGSLGATSGIAIDTNNNAMVIHIGAGVAPSTAAWIKPAASTTAVAQFNLPTGTAPTSPVDGDVWREDNTNTGLKIRVNGVTKTITLA